MSSRMEQIIEEIEEYIENCKYQPLSTTKIIVNKEELSELIAELRSKTPEEIRRYQKIISNKTIAPMMMKGVYFFNSLLLWLLDCCVYSIIVIFFICSSLFFSNSSKYL